MTDGVCGWCQLDFTCTGDNATCTGGADNWLTVSIISTFNTLPRKDLPNDLVHG